MPDLTKSQREVLLRPIKHSRVSLTQGQSYLEAFDVIAHLTRIFGYEGWDKEILRLELIDAQFVEWMPKNATTKKSGWDVTYLCTMRLTVRNVAGERIKVIEDVGTGSATHQPGLGDAHDLAVKSAVSGALKRCAKDLGDQFGLSLYDGGSENATVKSVVPYADEDAPIPPDDDKSAAGAFHREPPAVMQNVLDEARATLPAT